MTALGGENFRKKLQTAKPRRAHRGVWSFVDDRCAQCTYMKAKMGAAFWGLPSRFFNYESRSIIGVNMLRIADYKPDILKYCMDNVIQLLEDGKINPHVGENV